MAQMKTSLVNNLITSSGIKIIGIPNIDSDNNVYSVQFFINGVKVFYFDYEYQGSEYLQCPKYLNFIQLSRAILELNVIINLEDDCLKYLILGEENFDWALNNLEELSELIKECEKIIENNKGWEHYAKIRLI